MTWLYTLVFTGLFIASNGEVDTLNSYRPDHSNVSATAVENVQKDEIETFEQSYPLSANGRVSVSNINGSIEMIAWDRNEVRLEATKIADSREALADIELKIEARQNSFSIETDYKDKNWGHDRNGKNRKLEVRYKLSVPRTAILNEIETVNGDVIAANFVNVTKISTVNGDVNASNLRGTADLTTVNGAVNADFDELESNSKVDLSTVNGSVNLTIPSDANATIKADSLSGGITNAFGLPVRRGEYVGKDLHGRLGSGDAQIKLDSVNGRLAINKKNDGKPASPATNLLTKGEPLDEEALEMRNASARMRSDVRKATADAQRESAEALRTVNRELSKIKVEGLKDLKIDMDGLKMDIDVNAQIKESLKIQEKVLSRMQDAMFFADTPVVERKTNSFTVQGTPKVTIDAQHCDVRIRGWDKPEVKYVLTQYQNLKIGREIKVNETQSKQDIGLSVTGGELNWMNGRSPRLEIFVPRKSDLKIKTKGEIRLEGVSGELDLSGSENSIDVRGSDGKLIVTNTQGVVRVIDFKGDLVAKTKDGEVYLDGNFDRIDASSTEGKFILTVPANADADIQAPEDQISLDGVDSKKTSDGKYRIGKGGRNYKFSSVDGSVEVRNRDSVNSER